MDKIKGQIFAVLDDAALESVSGGFDSDEIYERFDGFIMKEKVEVNNAPPLPCPSCKINNTVILKGTHKGLPAWICTACNNMHYY